MLLLRGVELDQGSGIHVVNKAVEKSSVSEKYVPNCVLSVPPFTCTTNDWFEADTLFERHRWRVKSWDVEQWYPAIYNGSRAN